MPTQIPGGDPPKTGDEPPGVHALTEQEQQTLGTALAAFQTLTRVFPWLRRYWLQIVLSGGVLTAYGDVLVTNVLPAAGTLLGISASDLPIMTKAEGQALGGRLDALSEETRATLEAVCGVYDLAGQDRPPVCDDKDEIPDPE